MYNSADRGLIHIFSIASVDIDVYVCSTPMLLAKTHKSR